MKSRPHEYVGIATDAGVHVRSTTATGAKRVLEKELKEKLVHHYFNHRSIECWGVDTSLVDDEHFVCTFDIDVDLE